MKIKTSFLFTAFLLNAIYTFANDKVPVGCPTITMSGQQVSCNGGSDGSASVSVSGGTGPFTYTWSYGPGPSWTNSISGLPVGTYTVNVKDNATGCTVIGAYVIEQPDPVSILSSFVTNVNCNGGITGEIDITPTGGTPGYTYDWSNDGLGTFDDFQDAAGLLAGSYTLIVRDVRGCKDTSYYNVTQPLQALGSSGVVSNVSCNDGMNGSIDVSVWGGSPPYVYSWPTVSGGVTTQDVSGLTEGVYTQTITDVKGCITEMTYLITEPDSIIGSANSTDVSCFGAVTGSVSVSVTGGTSPYNYSWQNSQTLYASNSATINNVPADNYTVVVTDNNGCTFSASTTVNQPPLLSATNTITDVLCYGDFSGSIDATVSGGSPGYTFLWTNGLGNPIGNGEDLNAVQAGTYGLLITDLNGCTYSLSGTVIQPDTALYYSYTVTNVLCHGDLTGAIDLTVAGGTAPYAYSWSPGGATTQDISSIPAGTYSFGVLDDNGCPIGGSMIITQPTAPLAVTAAVTNVLCNGESNGAINLTTTGGTAPYSFTWENSTYELSLTTEDITGMPAESYTYLATDNNGCTTGGSQVITEPALLESSVTGVNILCFGGNNGSVDLTVTGGTTPYSFNWDNGATSEDLINLIAGTYTVIVTDAHNCTTTSSITLTQPDAPLALTFEKTDVKCNNGSDGTITAFVEGGTEPYNYAWSSGGNTDAINNLTAGVYSLDIVDFNGCTISGSIEIFQPDPLTLNEVITPVSCFGLSDGDIDVSPAGGTSPFDFTWFNSTFALSAQTEDLTDWPADIYQVEIVDSNGCFYEMFFEITQPELLVITYTSSAATCAGSSDADILVDITGGNPPYTTTWSNGATTEDLMDVPAGTYELDVVDTKGCTDSIVVTIIEPLPITMTFEVTEITCIDQKDGTAEVFAAGGNGGYYYDWSNGAITAFTDSLDNQYYTMIVTDVLGCTGTDSVFIPKNEVSCIDPVNTITPNGDNYNDTWVIDNMHLYPEAQLQIFNKWGNLIHEQTGIYEPWNGTMNSADAPSDQYYYILNLNYLDREPIIGNLYIVR
jgi:gliding motility-associated-like protein